ncbi:pectate lyase-domain-containing protein [Crucibulum laeve]|uniref:Pectate lyase n=1 Tax=Crucibulum laeve TaxID=68775 RepID=A0A5C3M149_9AGAR|nr:pectate lyase-domain-containing protein [Crucibulum laeve]
MTGVTTTRLVLFATFIRVALAAVPLYGQCGGDGWTGETTWSSLVQPAFTLTSKWYSQCIASSASPTTTTKSSTTTTKSSTTTTKSSTTTTKPATPTAAPSGITTVLPASAGYTALATASVISGSFDGKMVKYDRKGSSGECQGQTETGEEDAVFILQSGASISNVIIGKDQAEGIHCRGPCTVTNVWWEDVCEDAITIKQTGSGDVSTINGGGAFNADDKIVQHNGAGRVSISNFFASTFGKLYRACGNCATHYERHVTVNNVCLKSGSEGVGINTNWGDTATLSNIKTSGKPSSANVCCTYTGVNQGSEPSKIGCGDGYSACQFSSAVGSC